MTHDTPQAGDRVPITGDELVDSFPRAGTTADVTVLERPGRPASTVPPDSVLPPELAGALADDLYSHQATVLEALDRGEHVCVSTSTSSGKSRIYALQIARNLLEARARGDSSTAYLCYPTKALSRDQERALTDFFDELGLEVAVGVYDGDTKSGDRRRIREESDVIITNFAGVNTYLHDHDRWASFLASCELLVIDESHTYTGVHGMHVAWIVRRLKRVLAYYDADPQFVLTSATIGNPGEHSSVLIDEQATVVDEDGSPAGPRDLVLWNPPFREREADDDAAAIERVPATVDAPRLLSHLTYEGAQTLLFAPSRKLAELSVERALGHREETTRYYTSPDRSAAIEPYHAGLSRTARHSTEHQLETGVLDGVASTSALELGIDVGELDATVQLGYPGQRQSFWQQIGRAGRGTSRALSVLVADHRTLDQYVVSNPDYLLESGVEDAVVDVDNDAVFAQHLRCAADELALDRSDAGDFGDPERLERAVEMWRRAGQLSGSLETGVSYAGPPRPQRSISLYATTGEEYEVRLAPEFDDHHDPGMEPLAKERVLRDFHEGAVRLHQGQQYEVVAVDHESHRPSVTVQPVDVDYYTRSRTDVTVLDAVSEESREIGDFRLHVGRGRVVIAHDTYDELEIDGGEKRAQGLPTDNPPLSIETQLCWLEVPRNVEQTLLERYRDFSVPDLEDDLAETAHLGYAGGLHAAEHATIGVAPLELMVDKRDLGGLATLSLDAHLAQPPGETGAIDAAEGPAPRNAAAAEATVRDIAGRLDEMPASGWFIYDGIDGGLGFARAIYENFEAVVRRARDLIADCDCGRVDGCPACVMDDQCGNDNQPLHREAAVDVLESLLEGDAAADLADEPAEPGRRPTLFYA
ncbi:DEAD/DEAH box helicase [Natrarchaeobaculum aegyptiacum]|uniref:Helicase with metal-binding cysteine cluster n=1 Tax=Natrarchaeobaculum aegyptiacum TaxID=745377 RepID=A0A2Z2HVV6_9EURY|nr:DEAD/DEAH box helicase [Natrarchaeobaculum aegyptiacum]ARS91446.1 helicase with metal-binding cysteine cluster [Natrarchaeobaculum aegyptiacum]